MNCQEKYLKIFEDLSIYYNAFKKAKKALQECHEKQDYTKFYQIIEKYPFLAILKLIELDAIYEVAEKEAEDETDEQFIDRLHKYAGTYPQAPGLSI